MSRALTRPLIGVIGGLGPAATLDFYDKVLRATPARSDQEHVRLIIDADPEVPNRNEAVAGTGPSSAPALVAKALRLKAAGAELLVMPCNAAHAYLSEIEGAVDLPVISIIDEAVKAAAQSAPPGAAVGVLAASGTLDAGLYRTALAGTGLHALEPEGDMRQEFMALLYRIKAGDTGDEVRTAMAEIASDLVNAGANVVIAGCTEVPLVLAQDSLSVPFTDASLQLARAVVREGLGKGGRRREHRVMKKS